METSFFSEGAAESENLYRAGPPRMNRRPGALNVFHDVNV